MRKNTPTIILSLISIGMFAFLANMYIDPDFGYRISTGETILRSGFPKTDIYSYTMPSFPYVEHAWLIAISWAKLLPIIGYRGLAVISGLLAFLSLVISQKRHTSKNLGYLPKLFGYEIGPFARFEFILALSIFISFSGIRAQVVSWIVLAIYLHLLLREKLWNKYRYLMPIIFVAWANIHGSWGAGIALLFATVFFKSIRQKKILVTDGIIALLSLAATLINPYGTGIWREVWLSVSDSQIRWRIVEWMPMFLSADIYSAGYFTISTIMVWKSRKKISLENLGLYLLIFFQAFMSRRHIPLFILLTLPTTTDTINHMYQKSKKIKFGKERFEKTYKFMWLATIILLLIRATVQIGVLQGYEESKYYPKDALSFIKQDLPDGNIFSFYSWGGYLIREMPEKKVYIYGGMPSWRRDVFPDSETGNAFDDYSDIQNGRVDYKEHFTKYSINTVLLPLPLEKSENKKILEKKIEIFASKFGKEPDGDYDFIQEIENDGWTRIYSDSVAVIYKAPK